MIPLYIMILNVKSVSCSLFAVEDVHGIDIKIRLKERNTIFVLFCQMILSLKNVFWQKQLKKVKKL